MNYYKTLLPAAFFVALQMTLPAAAEPLGSSWADATKLPDFFTGSWQSVTPMLDGPVNDAYTAKAQDYIAYYKPINDIPFAGTNCKTPGMPLIQRAGSPLKFFYQPGMIAIYIENDSMTRFIKLNAEHSARPNPTYLGESVGHFEGDTLVVDSTGFADDIIFQYGSLPNAPPGPTFNFRIFGPHGPKMRMIERIRLLDPDTLEDQLTIDDDTVWKKPYVSSPVQLFKRNRGEAGWPREWVCESANMMPFDPAQNQVIERDPADILKDMEQTDKNSGK